MTAETTATTFQQQWQVPDWVKATAASHFSATIEAVDPTQVNQWVQTLVNKQFGYIYLTESVQNYGVLPNVYNDQVNALRMVNA